MRIMRNHEKNREFKRNIEIIFVFKQEEIADKFSIYSNNCNLSH